MTYKRAADGTTNRQTFSKTLSEIFVIKFKHIENHGLTIKKISKI